ncbi:hypothetical protein MPTK1_7g18000 [Marchantia polymorpha subsp. ruderalis]|uniref:Glucose/Sorbosone dehydrogenase domain-containing protein n=2 Tax=Marchantia polymorpha TaxID=3197 RepID=A0AAF6C0Y2_MARPO|nr:hypothetical protein MARPO_0102s0040 [Marchantia polymorpha]BBN17916.1 hypothetical protein Mp_7g18000 [Marchantia polymorpha subsp. ruderalis]|eukprot:PTQ32174.1 hypothetical protein MARPO_0102s0040 [Marchantia polymorpha]
MLSSWWSAAMTPPSTLSVGRASELGERTKAESCGGISSRRRGSMTRELRRLSRARRWISGLLTLSCLVDLASAYPLCTSMEAPVKYSQNLGFCTATEYRDKGCCSPREDNRTKMTFDSMNITDANCAAIVKQILCAKCDAFSATLFGHMNQENRKIPYLCTKSSKSNLTTTTGQSYCQDVWEACASVPMKNSIFAPVLLPGTSPSPSSSSNRNLAAQDGSLGSVFKSKDQFCAVMGPSASAGDEFCFDGAPFSAPPAPSNFTFPQDICVEKVGEDAYLNLVPFPDGSNRAAVSNQAGTVWLATIPEPGKAMVYNISAPFLDISDRVTNENELGFLGFAFHPDFKTNGRFFVSYNCDKQKWADCGGTCACNKETNCNPSDLRSGQLGGDGGTNPCRYSSIIAEYTVNSSVDPSASPLKAEVANPLEVRRIFTMALPYSTHHAGGLLFGPLDNYLYYMLGDGGNTGDPFNFAQNKKSLLGKILRLDVDNLPSATQITDQGLWGEYTAPKDNPFFGQNGSRPEIWALGLRNPWRCTFDSQNPTYMYCGDIGQERVQEVNLISKGGNYGWRIFEGNSTYVPPISPGGNTSARSVQAIFPILQYVHDQPELMGGPSAITGGYVSYSREDPCLYGKYVYADLFGTMWASSEVPKYSGNFRSSQINYLCSASSPLNCTLEGNSTSPELQEILSFGLDKSANFYILASNGVYRVVHPQNCGRVCTEVLPALPPIGAPAPSGSPSSTGASSPGPAPAQNSARSSRSQFLHISFALTLAALGSALGFIL